MHPDVGLGGEAIARGAAAVGLGALLTPLASILGFIEPGQDQTADCAKLIDETKARTAQRPPNAMPERRGRGARNHAVE